MKNHLKFPALLFNLRRQGLTIALIVALAVFLFGNDHYNVYALERKTRTLLPRAEDSGLKNRALRKRSWILTEALAGGDNCAGATNVTVSPFNDTGNTTGANNTISNYNWTALPYLYNGPDLYYRLNLVTGGTISATMTLTGSTLDGALYLINSCPAGTGNNIPAANTINASQDVIGGGAGPELLPSSSVPAGVYYIAVDSYYASGASSAGPYSITINATGLSGPTAAGVSVGGRIVGPNGRGLARVRVTATRTNGDVFVATSNSFGYYRLNDLPSGETYTITVSGKRNRFENPTRVVSVTDNITDLDFTGTN